MAEERAQRHLAAILAADVVGYSRLVEQDEAATMAALANRRKAILEPLLAKYCGRVVRLIGDGTLAEFASAVDAVQCAVDIQKAMKEANANLPEDHAIVLRVGVNLGDVVVEDGDLYGDGVNVAARLEAMAEPGGICLSAAIHQQVERLLPFAFRDLGDQVLKNIARPVRLLHSGRRCSEGCAPRSDPQRSHILGAEQAIHGHPAVRQHERRSGAGVLQRRYHRGHHHGPLEGFGALRHRPQHRLHLQGQGGGRDQDRPAAECGLRRRRQHAQGGRARADRRAANRWSEGRSCLGRPVRPQPH